MRVERRVVDSTWRTGDLAIVGWRIEVDDVEAVLEEVDARDEGFALDAVAVEFVGVAVGGGDEDDAVRHEGFEESGKGSLASLKVGEVGGAIG